MFGKILLYIPDITTIITTIIVKKSLFKNSIIRNTVQISPVLQFFTNLQLL